MIKALSVFIIGTVMSSISDDVILAELRALKVAQPALFCVPIDEDRDVVPAICEALNLKISSEKVNQIHIGILLDRYEMIIITNFLHLLPRPLPLLLFQSTGRSPQSLCPHHKHPHSLPMSPLMICHDFSTSLNLKHRQILLGRSALCTLLAKRLLCFQNAVAVDSARNHARSILMRGLSAVLRDAQATFVRGISWFSLPSFYVRIVNKVGRVAMLEVRPGDSIQNVNDRVISTMQPNTSHVRLICEGRALNPDNRVFDYNFLRPHSTLFVVVRYGP